MSEVAGRLRTAGAAALDVLRRLLDWACGLLDARLYWAC
jgi:hypothetical protein